MSSLSSKFNDPYGDDLIMILCWEKCFLYHPSAMYTQSDAVGVLQVVERLLAMDSISSTTKFFLKAQPDHVNGF
jgi:hypothetical protein